MNTHIRFLSVALLVLLGAGYILATSASDKIKTCIDFSRTRLCGNRSVEDVLAVYGPRVSSRLKQNNFIAQNGFPTEILIFANKADKVLRIYGRTGKTQKFSHIKDYPFTAFSGKLGPKLREGDRQIPEGIYEVEYLNPNSSYHLSLKVSYPNEFDRSKAAIDGRRPEELGGDIMIHGRSSTIGCIPIGDEAIEEVFVMVAKAGRKKAKIIISPGALDPRGSLMHPRLDNPPWYGELIKKIEQQMLKYKDAGIDFELSTI